MSDDKLKIRALGRGQITSFWSFYWSFPSRVALTYLGENILITARTGLHIKLTKTFSVYELQSKFQFSAGKNPV